MSFLAETSKGARQLSTPGDRLQVSRPLLLQDCGNPIPCLIIAVGDVPSYAYAGKSPVLTLVCPIVEIGRGGSSGRPSKRRITELGVSSKGRAIRRNSALTS